MKERIDYYQEIFGKKQRFPRYRLGDIHKNFFEIVKRTAQKKSQIIKKKILGMKKKLILNIFFKGEEDYGKL